MQLRGGRSQAEFGELLGFSRKYVSALETEVQEPSRNYLNAIRGKLGVSSDWVITGQGEKFVVHHTGSSAEAGAYEKDVRLREMLNLQPVPPPRTDHLPNMVLRDPSAEYSKGKWLHARTKGAAFGYAALTDSRDVRLKALTKDSEIEGTHLQRLAKDDAVWDRVGGMYGWEFEEMRHYFSTVGDRSVELWMHFLHFMRVSAGYTVAASADVKGQKGLKGRKG